MRRSGCQGLILGLESPNPDTLTEARKNYVRAETYLPRIKTIQKHGKKWLEMGYNPKDVWSISRLHRIHSEREDHPTQKPLEIIERMVKSSSPKGGVVLDPFAGTGTTIEACIRNERKCVAYELNSEYCEIIKNRVEKVTVQAELPFTEQTNTSDCQTPCLFNTIK